MTMDVIKNRGVSLIEPRIFMTSGTENDLVKMRSRYTTSLPAYRFIIP